MKHFLWKYGLMKRRLLRSALQNALAVGGEIPVIALLPADLDLSSSAGYWKADELLMLAEEVEESFDLNSGELFGTPAGEDAVMLAECRGTVLAAQRGAFELEGKRILLFMNAEFADLMVVPSKPQIRFLPLALVGLLYSFALASD